MKNQKKNQAALKEAGYAAALAGQPCSAPTTREFDRGAWEQGWRAGNKDRATEAKRTSQTVPLPSAKERREQSERSHEMVARLAKKCGEAGLPPEYRAKSAYEELLEREATRDNSRLAKTALGDKIDEERARDNSKLPPTAANLPSPTCRHGKTFCLICDRTVVQRTRRALAAKAAGIVVTPKRSYTLSVTFTPTEDGVQGFTPTAIAHAVQEAMEQAGFSITNLECKEQA